MPLPKPVAAQDVYKFLCNWSIPIKELKRHNKARFNRKLNEILFRHLESEYAKGRLRGFHDGQATLHPQNGKAFSEGRLLGLKQMDEALTDFHASLNVTFLPSATQLAITLKVEKLREEYELAIGSLNKYNVKF